MSVTDKTLFYHARYVLENNPIPLWKYPILEPNIVHQVLKTTVGITKKVPIWLFTSEASEASVTSVSKILIRPSQAILGTVSTWMGDRPEQDPVQIPPRVGLEKMFLS